MARKNAKTTKKALALSLAALAALALLPGAAAASGGRAVHGYV